MRTIATVCLGGDLADKLEAIAAAGFEGVEIYAPDLVQSRLTEKRIGRLARELGLRVVCLQPLKDFEGHCDPEQRGERLKRSFETMDALGTELLLIASNTDRMASANPERRLDDLGAAAEFASAHDKRIGFEALAWGDQVCDYRQAWEIVRRLDHPQFGLVLDSFHPLARNEPLELMATLPAERIFLVQLADAPRREVFLDSGDDELCKRQLLDWSRHARRFPGEGELALEPFYAAIAAIDYRGPLSIETFNDRYSAHPAADVAKQAAKALDGAITRIDALRKEHR